MAQLIIGSLIRMLITGSKKKPKPPPQYHHQHPNHQHGNPGDVEAANSVNHGAIALNPSGLTPEEEADAAKKKKIMRIVMIVGGLLFVCWLMEIPLLPMIKSAAKWLEHTVKNSTEKHPAGNDTNTAAAGGGGDLIGRYIIQNQYFN